MPPGRHLPFFWFGSCVLEDNLATMAGLPECSDSDADRGLGGGDLTTRAARPRKKHTNLSTSQRRTVTAASHCVTHALSGMQHARKPGVEWPSLTGNRKDARGWAFKGQNTIWASPAAQGALGR